MTLKNKNGIDYDFGHLSSKGLSMTQAQSISNLCYQKVAMYDRSFDNLNNFEGTILYNGEKYITQEKWELPTDIENILKERGENSSVQAFLMDNINRKAILLESIQNGDFEFEPEPNPVESKDWSRNEKDYLTNNEKAQWLHYEAICSRIGDFIHSGKPLDKLRNRFSLDSKFETVSLETGKYTPVKKEFHHTVDQLQTLHNNLSEAHRKYNEKLNYLKAKAKNAMSTVSIAVSAENHKNYAEYTEKLKDWTSRFEIKKKELMNEVSKLRIEVPQIEVDGKILFQDLINEYMGKVEKEEGTN